MSHSLGFRSADDVTIDCWWPDNCDAITWIVIFNSLDIDFIHGDIHGRSCKKPQHTQQIAPMEVDNGWEIHPSNYWILCLFIISPLKFGAWWIATAVTCASVSLDNLQKYAVILDPYCGITFYFTNINMNYTGANICMLISYVFRGYCQDYSG